mmetsp:Transcript_38727/g.66985  ORF Transcript_38727/g.66985 Transcript_38727/m.66985 type:complete len:243 (-) Transcript_38727:86-814(-)
MQTHVSFRKATSQLLPLFFLSHLRLGRLCDTLSSSRGSGISSLFGQALGFCAGCFDRVHLLHRGRRRGNNGGLCFGSGGLHGHRRGVRRDGAGLLTGPISRLFLFLLFSGAALRCRRSNIDVFSIKLLRVGQRIGALLFHTLHQLRRGFVLRRALLASRLLEVLCGPFSGTPLLVTGGALAHIGALDGSFLFIFLLFFFLSFRLLFICHLLSDLAQSLRLQLCRFFLSKTTLQLLLPLSAEC